MTPSAQITFPYIADCLERGRLFDLLETLESRSVTWVTAPPGAGKTILVACYLQRKRIKPIWYQLDERDAEPATFFHDLATAAGAVSERSVKLPPLNAEHAGDVHVFARNFFASLADLNNGPTLVFDDFQNLPVDSPTFELIAGALLESPRDSSTYIMSRSAPSGAFARLVANGIIGTVKPDELALNREEVARLLDLLGARPAGASCVDSVYERTNG